MTTITKLDIAWAAGFLEGEGCFGTPQRIRVTAAQVQLEPLERLQALFGGKISQKTPNLRPNESVCYEWVLHGMQAAEVMMTLYDLMSPKRKEKIAFELRRWSQLPHRQTWENIDDETKRAILARIQADARWQVADVGGNFANYGRSPTVGVGQAPRYAEEEVRPPHGAA